MTGNQILAIITFFASVWLNQLEPRRPNTARMSMRHLQLDFVAAIEIIRSSAKRRWLKEKDPIENRVICPELTWLFNKDERTCEMRTKR